MDEKRCDIINSRSLSNASTDSAVNNSILKGWVDPVCGEVGQPQNNHPNSQEKKSSEKLKEHISISMPQQGYSDLFGTDDDEISQFQNVEFETDEDAIQALVALASTPLPENHNSVMLLPMSVLLSRLHVEPRANNIPSEYGDPSVARPSSSILLIRKRLNEEYRMLKMNQQERCLAEERRIREQHERICKDMLSKHRAELVTLGPKDLSNFEVKPISPRHNIQNLEQHLANIKSKTMDAGTRRLCAFWKSKCEKTSEEIARVTERLKQATSEYFQLSQLNGRDLSYLEKTLAALRDDEMDEQRRGDTYKQQFLLECRRRGLTPTEVESGGLSKGTNLTVKSNMNVAPSLGNTKIRSQDGGKTIETSANLCLLPSDSSYVECLSEDGYRVPMVREVGMRIESLRKEIEVAEATLRFITESIEHRSYEFDELQTRFCELAGASVGNKNLAVIESSIRMWADAEHCEKEAYATAAEEFKKVCVSLKENTQQSLTAGRSRLRTRNLQRDLQREKQKLGIEHAQRKLIKTLSNEAEQKHLEYLNAHLQSLTAERCILKHELDEAERKLKLNVTNPESSLAF